MSRINDETKQELLECARKFNQAIEEAGKYRDRIEKILGEIGIDYCDFDEASDDMRGNWNQDFVLFHSYDVESTASFLEELDEDKEREEI